MSVPASERNAIRARLSQSAALAPSHRLPPGVAVYRASFNIS